jgi:hypothetical protein
MKTLFTIELKIVSTTLSEQKFVLSRFQQESKTTRKAGGLDFPAPMGGETQKHVCALKWLLKNVPLFERFFYNPLYQPQRFYEKRIIVAVVIRLRRI